MIKKCEGCGIPLQINNPKGNGYVNEKVFETALLCERCFKIKNYGESSSIDTPIDFEKILYDIDKSSDAVVYLVDPFTLSDDSIKYLKLINNNIYVLLTKRDVLPKSVSDRKLIKYFKENIYDKCEVMCVSSYKKKNIDEFLNIIKKANHKKIYIIGPTNSGKSTFINALMASVGNVSNITTSPIPNTTSDYINMKIGDMIIVDTPGFVSNNAIYNFLALNNVSSLVPKKEIKVKTFQIKPGFCVIVDNILRIDYEEGKLNSFSFYMNNNLKFQKMKITTRDTLKILPKKNIKVNGNEDIVINGLGFVKIVGSATLVVYTLDESLISTRKKLI